MLGEELVGAIKTLLSSSTSGDTHFLTNATSLTYTTGELTISHYTA